ncbi:Zinc finger MYM-type protein 1 [Anabarilius grahami]|uniref:Zinc finger MYM-type protein 1 n=1 Tax=Anabarilius grahami TaxID=495550 RepID=A0A3N0YRJ1_ANAGA|nr:Zinc finger MYM-type protein 1 [Anabarilius grahami]
MAVTCFLGKQGIAFRGRDETDESHNKGNFLECMSLLTKFDPFLQRYTAPSNTTYLSSDSQNEMIECCSQELTENIISEIKGAYMYAIIADEARDGKTEQLALCVRYVSVEGAVKERFLALTEVSQFDATSITAAIENQLVKKGIDQLKCVALTYDGAAVMSGDVGGLHRYLQKETIDIAQAVTYKNAVTDTMKQKRSDTTAADLYSRTIAMCEANQIAVESSSGQRRKRMDEYVVESTCGAGSETCGSSESEDLKRKLLFPCLDRMICELERHFSGVNEDVLNGILSGNEHRQRIQVQV